MRSLHLVRRELRRFLSDYPIPEMDAAHLAAIRSAPVVPTPPSPDVPNVIVEETHVPGAPDQPDVRVLVYRPTAAAGDRPAILHIHGGGMVLGAPEMADAVNRPLCAQLGAVIVSVDYRLPPEHPYPAPLDDCYAALAWLHAEAAVLGVDTRRIAVKGESAGGGLAAGLALLARDRGTPPLAFQCLTYPMIDDRAPAAAHPFTGEYVWTAPSNRFGWASYLGSAAGGAEVPCYAAPARAADLAGLPPTLIVTAALDLFLDENLDYARRLLHAGVPVELIVYPGTYHGFQMAGDTAIARRYERDVHAALAAAFDPDSEVQPASASAAAAPPSTASSAPLT